MEIGEKRTSIESLSPRLEGQIVKIRARVHNSRLQGNKMCFLQLRQQTNSVQGIVAVDDATVSKLMVRFAGQISLESIVVVDAVVQKALEPVTSTTISDVELQIKKVIS